MTAEHRIITVNVSGIETAVEPQPGWTIGAIATKARWQAGCGAVAFDNWEVRSADGTLLDQQARPGPLTELFVNRLAGVGA